MFKREIKVNFKNYLIWQCLLFAIFLIVFMIYPSIINSDNFKQIDEMMKIFPQEVLAAFNMDISSINNAYGWLKTEGMTFILLITGCYSGILGSQILLKEENDKTIEYLYSLPVKRSSILIQKFTAGAIYVTLLTVMTALFNLLALMIMQKLNIQEYLMLSLSPLLTSYVIYCLCFMLAVFAHRSKRMTGISLAVVMISYVLQIISTIAESADFLKYFSIFTLADTRNIITEQTINPVMVIITVMIALFCLLTALFYYQKKELV